MVYEENLFAVYFNNFAVFETHWDLYALQMCNIMRGDHIKD